MPPMDSFSGRMRIIGGILSWISCFGFLVGFLFKNDWTPTDKIFVTTTQSSSVHSIIGSSIFASCADLRMRRKHFCNSSQCFPLSKSHGKDQRVPKMMLSSAGFIVSCIIFYKMSYLDALTAPASLVDLQASPSCPEQWLFLMEQLCQAGLGLVLLPLCRRGPHGKHLRNVPQRFSKRTQTSPDGANQLQRHQLAWNQSPCAGGLLGQWRCG